MNFLENHVEGSGGTISRPHVVSPIELRIRQFLKGKKNLGLSVSSTLLGLYEWTTSIQAGGLEGTLSRITAMAICRPGSDLIENIAESLIQNAVGIERDLLSKSLQETLYYCVGTDTDASPQQITARLTRFLKRHGTAALIQRFLSLCFFDFVWFETGESFRALARTSREFEKDLENVERICKRAVATSWKSYQMIQRPLDRSAAEELIRNIEQRLRGV